MKLSKLLFGQLNIRWHGGRWKVHNKDEIAIVGLASVHLKFKSIKAVIRAGLLLPRRFKSNT
jgi:hypothetical protein